jgi:hypothetical protein
MTAIESAMDFTGEVVGDEEIGDTFLFLQIEQQLDVKPHRWIAFNPGVDVFQPAVPPSQGFLKEADRGLGHGEMRVFVDPRPDDTFNRGRQPEDQPRHGILVGVTPTANSKGGGFDARKIFADRPPPPVIGPCLVAQPQGRQKGSFASRSSQMSRHLSPTIAGSGGREE